MKVSSRNPRIQDLLIDLKKAENTTYVTPLGLDAYLAELEKENNAVKRPARKTAVAAKMIGR